jgi:hypothetical protein
MSERARARCRPLPRRWGGAAALLVATAGCAAQVPVPPPSSHQGDVPVAVPYPPPVAQVEMVGPAPDADALWVDGSWQWTGESYSWSAGSWQHPPAGATLAPPLCVRRDSGELVYFPPSWHGPDGEPAPASSSR